MKVPCVTAILYNAEGQVLLHQRDSQPGLSFAGCWSTLGGKVEEGETPEEAMRRELWEEIERDIPLRLWKVYERPHSDEITVVQHVFVGTVDESVAELRLNEGQALRYFGRDALDTLPIGFGFESLLRDWFSEGER